MRSAGATAMKTLATSCIRTLENLRASFLIIACSETSQI
jgi:hypothetical protein